MTPKLRAVLQRTRPVRFPVAVCAHRGNSEEFPENTLAAFRSAIELGVDAIELDVRLTADRRIVVLHDGSLERTTGLDQTVAKLPLDQVLTLDAGGWKGRQHRGERVPELHKVLDLADGKAAVIIELKQRSQYLARAVTRLLRERQLERRAIVLSFYWTLLRTVKELSPDTLTLAAFGVRAALLRLALRLPYADGLGARASLLSARVRHSCLNRRKFLAAWSVNDEDKLHRLLRNKAADLIVTDRPRAILSLLENLKSSSHGAHGRAGDAPGPSAVDSHHGPT